MLNRFLIILIVFLTCISCEQHYILNTIYIFEDYLSTSNDTINIPFERIATGDYSFKVNNEVLKTGNLINSGNQGDWKYNIINKSNKTDSTITWSIFSKEKYSYSIPITWKIFETNDTTKILAIDLKPNLGRKSMDNNFLLIQTFKKEGKSLSGFNNYNINEAQKLFEIKAHDYIKVELNDSIWGYYNRFETANNNQILNYNFETKDSVFELSMKTESSFDKTFNQLIFFEFIRSFQISGNPVLPRKGKLTMDII